MNEKEGKVRPLFIGLVIVGGFLIGLVLFPSVIPSILWGLELLCLVIMSIYVMRMYLFSITTVVYRNRRKNDWFPPPNHTVSILIPAHNEEKVIGRLLDLLVKQDYPHEKMEIIVLNDASKDRTSEIAHSWERRYPDLIKVVDRERGGMGKSDVMNQGIKMSKNEIIVVFDADYTPKPDTISRLVRWFNDPKVGLVQGRIYVHNKEESLLTRIIAAERFGGFDCDMFARDVLKLGNQYGGTVGAFRKKLIEELGTWDPKTLAEDTDLTCRALIAGYKIKYDVSIDCGEEAPNNIRVYMRQRYRWIRGHTECALRYTWKLLRSPHLSLREKIDSVLWINSYSVALLVLVGFALWIARWITGIRNWVLSWWGAVIYAIISAMGLGSMILAGCYVSNELKYAKYFPLIIGMAYPMCFGVSAKAFLDIAINRERRWIKTERSGKLDKEHCGSHLFGSTVGKSCMVRLTFMMFLSIFGGVTCWYPPVAVWFLGTVASILVLYGIIKRIGCQGLKRYIPLYYFFSFHWLVLFPFAFTVKTWGTTKTDHGYMGGIV